MDDGNIIAKSRGKPTRIERRSEIEAFKSCWASDIIKFKLIMGKKGLSLEEKRQKILEIYYEKVYYLKWPFA